MGVVWGRANIESMVGRCPNRVQQPVCFEAVQVHQNFLRSAVVLVAFQVEILLRAFLDVRKKILFHRWAMNIVEINLPMPFVHPLGHERMVACFGSQWHSGRE